jgi:hypothetical protein
MQMSRNAEPEKPNLRGDQRGAILVIGVFMAIFLTAMLAYVAGIAQTVWYREQMQDAADGTAISAAIVMARGMNLVVLINLIMEGLVMIILILQLLVTILAIVALILAACFLYPAAAAVAQIGYQVYDISNQVKDVVFEVLPVLHDLETVVRAVTPFVAEADSVNTSRKDYPVVDFGFLVPSRLTLPLEPGTYQTLCRKAGEDLIETIVDAIPGIPRMVAKKMGQLGGGMIGALSIWFCGDEGSSGPSGFESGAPPPTTDKEYNEDYPDLANRDACIEVNLTMKRPEGGGQPCEEYNKEVQRRLPGKSGTCEDASDQRDCYQSAGNARAQCNPLTHPNVGDYVYSTGTIERTFVMTKGEWVEDRSKRRVVNSKTVGERPIMTSTVEPTPESLDAVTFDADPDTRTKYSNPCQGIWDSTNNWRSSGPKNQEWNETPFEAGNEEDEDQLEPVCSEPMEALPVAGQRSGEPTTEGTEITRSTNAVMQVYFCAEVKKKSVPIVQWDTKKGGGQGQDQGGSQEENDDDKSPYIVEKDVFLGDDDFQTRIVIIGNKEGIKRPALDAARWGRPEREKEQILKTLDYFGNVSVAQAEFFYEAIGLGDGEENSGKRDDWMWNMRWRARLKRFTLPSFGSDEGGGSGESGGSSGASGGNASTGRGTSRGVGSGGSSPGSNGSSPGGNRNAGKFGNTGNTANNTAGGGQGGNPIVPVPGQASLQNAGAYVQNAAHNMDFGSMMKDELMKNVKSSVLDNCESKASEMGAGDESAGMCGGVIQAVDQLGGMFGH